MTDALDGNALATVFSFLDIFTIVKLAQVNKVWAKAVQHEKVTAVLDLSSNSTISTRIDIGKAMPHLVARYSRGPGLKVLVLKGCYSLKEEHLEKILELGKNTLQTVDLESCIALRSLSGLSSQPFLYSLSTLNLSKCRAASFPSITCPALQSLKLTHCDSFLQIKTLVGNAALELMKSCCSSLTSLNLSSSHISDEWLTSSICQLTALRTLILNDCNTISSKGVKSLSTLSLITYLDLSWCNMVGDDALVPLFSHLHNIRHLKLAQVYNITDATCKAISSLSQLQLLDLEEDFCITNAALSHLSLLPSLRHIVLRGSGVDKAQVTLFERDHPNCVVKF